ncbi:MAG: hypothetical protein HY515_01700 [Candidatus Aenigmarchaeota archaeon]|nr:hypothetical protein [Candidatus Aenigmarchaeota archaeon]
MEDVSKRDTCSSVNVIGDKTLAIETSHRTNSATLTPFVGANNFYDFDNFTQQHGLGHVFAAVEPYASRLPNWLGVRDGKEILAITPYIDDSADFGKGNRRVKPSSEIMPFSVDPDAAEALVETWQNAFPNATRYGNIRVPNVNEHVQKGLGMVGVAEALRKHGYKVEAANNGLFYAAGQRYDVEDFAKIDPSRLELFPERGTEWFKKMERLVRNGAAEPPRNSSATLVDHFLETHDLRRARPEDLEKVIDLLTDVFPVYGTYDLRSTMRHYVTEQHQSASPLSIVYVAIDRETGRADSSVTVERSAFGTSELTDVANRGKVNGLGYMLSVLSLLDAEQLGTRTWWTDAVPAIGMNKLARRLHGRFAGNDLSPDDLDYVPGIHRTTVKLTTKELEELLGRRPHAMDLLVHNGDIADLHPFAGQARGLRELYKV